MLVNYKTKFILFVIFGLALSFVPGCEKPKTVSQPPPTVTIARPISTETIDWNEFTGRLEATNVVNVRARVSGYLESIHFKEGNIVKQGDLLFVIDPRPYTAELERAQGQLATAEATQKLAGIELDRIHGSAGHRTAAARGLCAAADGRATLWHQHHSANQYSLVPCLQ